MTFVEILKKYYGKGSKSYVESVPVHDRRLATEAKEDERRKDEDES